MQEIFFMAINIGAKAKRYVEERVKAGKCLCCENPALKRGLCHQCYYKWRSLRLAIGSQAKRASYDARLIRAGKLLAPQAVREIRASSPFSQAAAEVE